MQFFTLKLSRIDKKTQKDFLNSSLLADYRHYLERLFAASKYLLSDDEEKIMNLKESPSYTNWVRMTSSMLSSEVREVKNEDKKKVNANFSQITSLIDSKDKIVRDSAAKAFNEILKKYLQVAEAEINSILENKKVDDELRGIKRPDEARHIVDDIDTSAVDHMIDAVTERFDIPRRYYRLKAKAMGLSKLKYHERNVPMGDFKSTYSFGKSTTLISDAFHRLDPVFKDIFNDLLEGSQIDVYPRKGKVAGAFCSSRFLGLPTYILINHQGNLHDVLTLAHESGHAINYELMKNKQNSLNYGMPLSTAEVASTFFEDFVLNDLLLNADPVDKKSLMMMKLNEEVSTIFRQVACYRFEQELHKAYREKGFLSSQDIGKLFSKHMKAYMGDYVDFSEGSDNWWVHWHHIRYFFYNYSYASGLLISKYLQKQVRKDSGFTLNIKGFLEAGEEKSPKKIFNKLGIDISDKNFWKQGLLEIEDFLKSTEKVF
jgi:oligoendopeptidase F